MLTQICRRDTLSEDEIHSLSLQDKLGNKCFTSSMAIKVISKRRKKYYDKEEETVKEVYKTANRKNI